MYDVFMQIHTPVEHALKNGCRYVLIPVENVKKVAISMSFRLGMEYFSITEQHLPHLLEHLLLNDKDGEDINESLSQHGAIANAHTDNISINITATAPNRHALESITILIDTVFAHDFNEELFEKERSIVLREVQERHDGIQPRVVSHLLHHGHDSAFPELWETTLIDIENIKYQDVQKLHKDQICPQNMTFIIAGDPSIIEEANIRAVLEKIPKIPNFKPRKQVKSSQPKPFYQPAMIDLGNNTLFSFCFDAPITNDPTKRIMRNAADFILLSGPVALLDKELRKSGSVYSIDADGIVIDNSGISIFNAVVERKLAPQAVVQIFRTILRVANGEITEKELRNLKNGIINSLENDLDSVEDALGWYMEDLLRKRQLSSPEAEIARIEKFTAQDIAQATRDIYVNSTNYWTIASGDAPFWATDIDKDFANLKSIDSKASREEYLDKMLDRLTKAYREAPERVGFLWASYYFLCYLVFLTLVFAPAIPFNNETVSFFGYGMGAGKYFLLVTPLLQLASGALSWIKGQKEWLVDRISILTTGLASVAYFLSLFVILDGFQTFSDGGWWLIFPTAFYLIAAPIATISVIRLSLYDKFKK